MGTENVYAYFELRPGMDVYDASGEYLGTVQSMWEETDRRQRRELLTVVGICPPAANDPAVAAGFCLSERGYLVVTSGLISRHEYVIPLQSIQIVEATRVILSITKEELRQRE